MGTKSAVRSARRAQRRRLRTRAVKSQVKTAITKARRLLAAGDQAAAEAVTQAVRLLDRASTKGIIHPNAAGRHKSRLVKLLNQRQAAK